MAHVSPNPVSLNGVLFGLEVCLTFTAALFAAALVLPGKNVLGPKLADGKRRPYKIVGMSLFVATHMIVFVGAFYFDWSLTKLIEEFWSLLVAANLFTLGWFYWMFRRGKNKQDPEDAQDNKGPLAEMWEGVELNPELAGVDLKVFAYHPSLIGLGILNVAFAWAQWEQLGSLTPQMWLYQGFWWIYLLTLFYFEEGVLTMWDVIAEKFGFMLLWGDLVLVPFFYCVGGWYLVNQTEPMSWTGCLALVVLFSAGIWIFRGSNWQKNAFKADPTIKIWGKPAETIGGRLLVSGFWGIGRKINYTGEIMVYSSIALTTGWTSIVPYLLPLWLCVLLPHRAWRDEKRCQAKYGEMWSEYRKVAKFRMIPFLY